MGRGGGDGPVSHPRTDREQNPWYNSQPRGRREDDYRYDRKERDYQYQYDDRSDSRERRDNGRSRARQHHYGSRLGS